MNSRLTESSSNFPRYGQTGAGKTYTLYGTPQEDHWSCRESTPCCKGAIDGYAFLQTCIYKFSIYFLPHFLFEPTSLYLGSWESTFQSCQEGIAGRAISEVFEARIQGLGSFVLCSRCLTFFSSYVATFDIVYPLRFIRILFQKL